ncbi:hypothetical protein SDC9_138698 [bioreactor metagenome]|uniref:Uncharacterized protein n=1 Tax=bioreactor metagenome TaxID=1076179 RepID=A0A645DQG5_9ZZZZ
MAEVASVTQFLTIQFCIVVEAPESLAPAAEPVAAVFLHLVMVSPSITVASVAEPPDTPCNVSFPSIIVSLVKSHAWIPFALAEIADSEPENPPYKLTPSISLIESVKT